MSKFEVTADPRIAKGFVELRSEGQVVYAGPLGSKLGESILISEMGCDEMALNPEDATSCLKYIAAG